MKLTPKQQQLVNLIRDCDRVYFSNDVAYGFRKDNQHRQSLKDVTVTVRKLVQKNIIKRNVDEANSLNTPTLTLS